jgi:hypothetical protein
MMNDDELATGNLAVWLESHTSGIDLLYFTCRPFLLLLSGNSVELTQAQATGKNDSSTIHPLHGTSSAIHSFPAGGQLHLSSAM